MRVDYRLYQASDADEMASVLGEVFAKHDPPAVATGITPSEFTSFVKLCSPNTDATNLTIVARSADGGEMVGALLAEDSASPMPEGVDRLGPKFDPIFDILGRLGADYPQGDGVQPGESVHLFLLGVAARFGGQGIAQRLVSECLENARRLGYRLAVTEATNKTSQHIFHKQGFVDRARQSYADHRFDGRAVFGSIVEHGGPILMDKTLGET